MGYIITGYRNKPATIESEQQYRTRITLERLQKQWKNH